MTRRLAAAAATAVVLALPLAAAGCSPTDEGADVEDDAVDWDLSEPRTPRELGSPFEDRVAVDTPGADGVDVRIVLPGGEVVAGDWRQVSGSADADGTLVHLALATTNLRAPAEWEPRIDALVARWGFDRAEIDAYLEELQGTNGGSGGGGVAVARRFPGERAGGTTPALSLQPGGPELRLVARLELELTYP